MNATENCPKCGERMAEGYLLDASRAPRLVSRWAQGSEDVLFSMAAMVHLDAPREVHSYYCVSCGFLESMRSNIERKQR